MDKFCDRDFGFVFARKLPYQEIKTTTLTTPNSRRNKTVNTYINYSELEFDSGESFAKLKAKVELDKDFKLYKPSIEIGSSIRFTTAEDSLMHILELIQHVELIIDREADRYHIPVFSKIKDVDKLQLLENNLMAAVADNPAQVNISELDIIGVTEVFNHNDGEFELSYRNKKKVISTLTSDEIKLFCNENGWDYNHTLLEIAVISLYNGHPVVTKKVRDLIDYTDDVEKCLLSKGIWYQYNDVLCCGPIFNCSKTIQKRETSEYPQNQHSSFVVCFRKTDAYRRCRWASSAKPVRYADAEKQVGSVEKGSSTAGIYAYDLYQL